MGTQPTPNSQFAARALLVVDSPGENEAPFALPSSNGSSKRPLFRRAKKVEALDARLFSTGRFSSKGLR